MPHPSSPLDDIRARSFDREHGSTSVESRGRLVLRFAKLLAALVNQNHRVERLSDGFLWLCSIVVDNIAMKNCCDAIPRSEMIEDVFGCQLIHAEEKCGLSLCRGKSLFTNKVSAKTSGKNHEKNYSTP